MGQEAAIAALNALCAPPILACVELKSPEVDQAGLSPEGTPQPIRAAPDADELRLRGWILQISRGDEQALGALYDATLGRVYGLARRITRNDQLAEEVAEDVYWQVWRQ